VLATWTLPKLMLAGAAVSAPGGVLLELFLPELNPWHPTNVARASTTTSVFQREGRLISVVLSPMNNGNVSVQLWEQLRKVPKVHAPGARPDSL
jgi:hypothetical protein